MHLMIRKGYFDYNYATFKTIWNHHELSIPYERHCNFTDLRRGAFGLVSFLLPCLYLKMNLYN